MKIYVIKRSGEKEELIIEKWQNQVAKICAGIADVRILTSLRHLGIS